jgi:carboxylesterase type B
MQSFTQTYTTTTHTTTTHQIFVTEEHTTSTIAQVYVRIEDLAGTIWKGQVEIPQSTIIECYNSGKTYTIQGDNVLAVLDKASEVGGFSYQVSDQWYPDIGFYVDSIAGHQAQGEYGWMYRVNYSLGDTSINNFSIHASDDILIYWGTDGVRPLKVEVDQSEVDVNETFTATVKYRDDSTGNWIPLAEAKLHVNDDYTTDSEGKVRLTLGEKKVYNIYAEKWGDTSQNQFVRSDIVQVGVGVPVPEIHYLFPVFVACVAAVLYINCSSRKKAAGVPK